MAERTCSIEGCPRKYAARGWCATHLYRWNKYGTTDPPPPRARKPEVCKFDGCDLPANRPGAAKGYCNKHYGRLYKHGDPSVSLIKMDNDPVCTVEGCTRPHWAKGLCANHYDKARQARMPACSVDGCELSAKVRSWCQAHYIRWKKTGSTEDERPVWGCAPEGHAWCHVCRTVKPLPDFIPNANRPNGVNSYCRECTTELRRTKYRDRIYVQQKRWRVANPEASARYNRNWQQANPDKVRAKFARQKAANPERYRLYARAGEANRRAREKNAPGHATSEQIMARWAYFGYRCWMCGKDAEVTDHVKPLMKGGSNWPANMRPACDRCNNSKRAKWPFPLEVFNAGRTSHGQAA